MNSDTYASGLSSFYKMLVEALKDDESNETCQKIMDLRPFEKQLIETEFHLNIELLLLFIDTAIMECENRIDSEALNKRAQLMQKLIIPDEYHLLDFLSRVVLFLHAKHLPLDEIDKAISILHSQNVIPSSVKNHWTYAKSPDGQSSETIDRLYAIQNCLVFKEKMSYDPNEDEGEKV